MPKASKDTLVIPDIHQHVAWADAILQREAKGVQSVVFLGDYFDPKLPEAVSAAETARYVASLRPNYPQLSFTFLIGNHDLPYLFDLQHSVKHDNPYTNNAYDPSYSAAIAPSFTPSFRSTLQAFTLANGRLLSHAGLHPSFEIPDNEADLQTLKAELANDIAQQSYRASHLLTAIGTARGGEERHGGLLWQDWHVEFEDTLHWPQIVGHTILDTPASKGRSWNLDTRKGNYAILSGDEIEIMSLSKT